jgi:hypothetical protein
VCVVGYVRGGSAWTNALRANQAATRRAPHRCAQPAHRTEAVLKQQHAHQNAILTVVFCERIVLTKLSNTVSF